MNRVARISVLSLLAFLLVQPVDLLLPRAFAAAPATAPSRTKKKKRQKPKEIILKGHHGKKKKRPA
jgi:hypothetical protein